MQVKARGAKLIIITDKKSLASDLDDDPIVIPTNGPLTALGAVLPLQLIAYELAMLKYVMILSACIVLYLKLYTHSKP